MSVRSLGLVIVVTILAGCSSGSGSATENAAPPTLPPVSGQVAAVAPSATVAPSLDTEPSSVPTMIPATPTPTPKPTLKPTPKPTLRPTPKPLPKYVTVTTKPGNGSVTAWCPKGYFVLSGSYALYGSGWLPWYQMFYPSVDYYIRVDGAVSSGSIEGWRVTQLLDNAEGVDYMSIKVTARCGR